MSLMYCALNSNGSGWLASFIYVYQNMLAMFSPWCQQYPKLHCDSKMAIFSLTSLLYKRDRTFEKSFSSVGLIL